MAGVEESRHAPIETSEITTSSSNAESTGSFGSIDQSARRVAREEAKEEVRKNLPRFTEILGVFVALFTFVSIQIQIFSRVTSLGNAVVFSFLIFLCMIGFLFMLHMIMAIACKDNAIKSTILPFLGLLIIIVVGVTSIIYLKKYDVPLNKQEGSEIEGINDKLIKHDSDIENLKEFIQYSRK